MIQWKIYEHIVPLLWAPHCPSGVPVWSLWAASEPEPHQRCHGQKNWVNSQKNLDLSRNNRTIRHKIMIMFMIYGLILAKNYRQPWSNTSHDNITIQLNKSQPTNDEVGGFNPSQDMFVKQLKLKQPNVGMEKQACLTPPANSASMWTRENIFNSFQHPFNKNTGDF